MKFIVKFVFVLFCDRIVYSSRRWEIYMDQFRDTNLATKIMNPTKITSIQHSIQQATLLVSLLAANLVLLFHLVMAPSLKGLKEACIRAT